MTKQQSDQTVRRENSLGELLYKTRKEQQKTLAEAAATTRVNVLFLQALEQDDYAALPAEIFVRGFIKLYATYLGLDPDDTLRHYLDRDDSGTERATVAPYPDDIIDTELLDKTSIFKTKKPRKTLPIIILLAILTLFYFLGIFFKTEEHSSSLLAPPEISSPPVDAGVAAPTGPETAPETAVESSAPVAAPPVKAPAFTKQKSEAEKGLKVEPPVAPAVPVRDAAPAAESPPAAATPADAGAAAAEQAVAPAAPAVAAAPETLAILPRTVKVATANNQPPQAPTRDQDFTYILEAQFKENSLVRIKVDDRPQLEYYSQAGIVRIWKAHTTIQLGLDNRPGVVLTLNGQPLPVNSADQPDVTINIPGDFPTAPRP